MNAKRASSSQGHARTRQLLLRSCKAGMYEMQALLGHSQSRVAVCVCVCVCVCVRERERDLLHFRKTDTFSPIFYGYIIFQQTCKLCSNYVRAIGVQFPAGTEIFLFTASRPAQWVPETLLPGVKLTTYFRLLPRLGTCGIVTWRPTWCDGLSTRTDLVFIYSTFW